MNLYKVITSRGIRMLVVACSTEHCQLLVIPSLQTLDGMKEEIKAKFAESITTIAKIGEVTGLGVGVLMSH